MNQDTNQKLPDTVLEYINLVVKKVKYHRKVRDDVRQELTDHFTDALAEYQMEEQRQQAAEKLIADFGDPKLLAHLIRRGKKRCRPLWKKAVIRFLQCLPLLYAALVLYNIWIIHTWKTHGGDFLEKFNQVSRPVVKEETNAWQHYRKAADLYVALPKEYENVINSTSNYEELDEPAQEALRKWIHENEPAWQEMVQGTRLPYCWTEFQTGQTPEKNMEELMKSMGEFRALARLGGWRMRCDVADNRNEEALEECLVVVKMGRHILSQQMLVEKLVGIALNAVGCAFIDEVLSKSQVELKKLAQTQQMLEHLPRMESMLDMRGEVYYSLAFHEQMIQATQKNPLKWLIPTQVILTGSVEKTKSNLVEFYDKIWLDTPYQSHMKGEKGTHSASFPSSIINLHLKLLGPSLERTSVAFYRTQTFHDATVTILALHRWHLEKGEYPEDLPTLVTAGYLQQLPEDHFSDGNLHYEKRGDDFILYSVGEDFVDSGGVETWDHGSHQGDWILWPVSQ